MIRVFKRLHDDVSLELTGKDDIKALELLGLLGNN
jgi:hypothetical protein